MYQHNNFPFFSSVNMLFSGRQTLTVFDRRSMFQENTEHMQPSLFGIANQFSPEKIERLKKSKEYYFYHLVFCKIREKDFEVLFSKEYSRPNAPVNSLVSAIILMTHHGWP